MKQARPFSMIRPCTKTFTLECILILKIQAFFIKHKISNYVKSDVIYHNAEIKSEDSNYTFIFDTSYFTPNSDNAKNKAVFKFKIDEEIRIYVLNNKEELQDLPNVFKQNSSDLSDEFIKALKDKQIRLQEEEIKKILYAYKKQNEVDFFIHKNARVFLQEQFNLWMFKYVVDDITDWSKEKIDELNQLKKIAFRIIDFIADFEDELKAIWCKPKFAKNVHYVFSLDTISNHARDSEQILESIFQDTGFKQQIKEWQELKLIDEHFEIKNINDEQYKFLPLDTKYLSEENYYKLLGAFDNLDEILHGELIKSDNFQALNSLMPKYQDKIDLIYIDPPFNTGSDFEYKDRFQDSTWLSLMHNRLELAKEFLSDRGSFYLHLDHNANYLGRELLNEIFGEENFINEIIWRRKQATSFGDNYFGIVIDTLLLFSKGDGFIFYPQKSLNDENTQKYIKERFVFNDGDGRKYMKSPLVNSLYRPNLKYEFQGIKPPKNGWLYSKEKMQQMYENNELLIPI